MQQLNPTQLKTLVQHLVNLNFQDPVSFNTAWLEFYPTCWILNIRGDNYYAKNVLLLYSDYSELFSTDEPLKAVKDLLSPECIHVMDMGDEEMEIAEFNYSRSKKVTNSLKTTYIETIVVPVVVPNESDVLRSRQYYFKNKSLRR